MKTDLKNLNLPLFPLNAVLFPKARLPLHIFEERYKLMMDYVLSGDRKFGVVFAGEEVSTFAEIGCIAEVRETKKFFDGRMNIDTIGTERFKVKKLKSQNPFIIAQVEMLEDPEPDQKSFLQAAELKEILNDVIRISSGINGVSIEVGEIWPEDPVTLSYSVPEALYGDLATKQSLLAVYSVNERLKIELSYMKEARNYLLAQKALKDAVG